MTELISAHVKSIEIMRSIYNSSEINDYGDVVIPHSVYDDIYKDLLNHIERLERVVSASTQDT